MDMPGSRVGDVEMCSRCVWVIRENFQPKWCLSTNLSSSVPIECIHACAPNMSISSYFHISCHHVIVTPDSSTTEETIE
jgi:hypothetical protein